MLTDQKTILILAGDGIGPEVTAEAEKIIKLIANASSIEFTIKRNLIGGCAIDRHGSSLPLETLADAKNSDAILLGAVGGPQWPRPTTKESPIPARPEEGLLLIRKELNLFANIRPCYFAAKSLLNLSPLKESVVEGTNFTIIRELTGGIYFGNRKETSDYANGTANDTMIYTAPEIARITRIAGKLATAQDPPLLITSVDKANVLATSRLWRKVVTDTLAKEFPQVPLRHYLVDSTAMEMIKNPTKMNGIILTENMFGDILSDEASVIPGSLGLLPSASLSGMDSLSQGLYEPIHGSAPDIAGQGIANPIGSILSTALMFRYSFGLEEYAQLIEKAVEISLDNGILTKDLGGSATTSQVGNAVAENLKILLKELKLQELSRLVKTDSTGRIVPSSLLNLRRPMTLCEKIICHSAIGLTAPFEVKPGDMVCVKVDWTLASELTWKGMEKTFDEMGRPSIYRNDRFWLAIDHTVDPSINHLEKPKKLIEASERFSKEVDLVDFLGPNQSILHTEFYRERAQPGMMIIGADSHSCSAGALSTFAVGLGAADVVMPLVTGETWFKVPETVEIKFIGIPPRGIGGKDIILHVLGELKRNTVAFERAVEWTGPGLKYLSCDARFAISNMTTEFGGIAGVFLADEITSAFISKRTAHNKDAIFFRADEKAEYVETHIIDLSLVESMVALYPSPDNVVLASEVSEMDLDGCFIGACTTGEEDLILGALVLEQGLKMGRVPVVTGKRKVTPGSVSIVAKLRRLGLLKIYQDAGFEIGSPGCSYCLGIAADRAGEGEVWLSSQNRNFKNRMGKGSIANLASAATVAASSFEMKLTDPRPLLDAIDHDRFLAMLENRSKGPDFIISEPAPFFEPSSASTLVNATDSEIATESIIAGKVQRFGDHIDTDAIIPAEFMPGTSDADLGTHCFQYVRPEFREKAKAGFNIVVAGIGFGSGSSREEAPRALKGIGITAVIAKSYAYIYGRNQPNMALLGVIVKDDLFYELAVEGSTISLDKRTRTLTLNGVSLFKFELSRMEQVLIEGGGVTELYRKHGSGLFRKAIEKTSQFDKNSAIKKNNCGDSELVW